MKRQAAYWTGTHKYTFKPGEKAYIAGIEMCTPEGKEPRACIMVLYSDGCEDWIPLSEVMGKFPPGIISE